MSKSMMLESPHRRYNPLTGEWILCSPHRAKRPWQGQNESASGEGKPEYEPSCYLCPGNDRVGGGKNPQYADTFTFENDFCALLDENGEDVEDSHQLFQHDAVKGTCKVICFSPNHGETIAQMEEANIKEVIETWMGETRELGEKYKWVQVFENKGAVMGCSNPHPHGQVWAMSSVPTLPSKEDVQQRAYFRQNRCPLLLEYAAEELRRGERIVDENADWLVVVPYWATWPFETLLLPRNRQVKRITDLDEEMQASLSRILKRMLVKYDNLFECDFPYSMGWHGAPFNGESNEHWQLHAHFYPPLLRSAAVKKFMVGFEMLGEAQRDITAEKAAEMLRAMSEVRFDLVTQ